MKNILNFVTKNHILILFVLLEVLSLGLLYRHSYYQRASLVNSSNYVSGEAFSAYHGAIEYVNLKKVNEELAMENAALRSLKADAYIALQKFTFDKEDTIYKQRYRWFTAKVINNSTNRRNNYLTLNRGSLLGVQKEMAIVSSGGIVGIVKDVTPHFSSVMSILHKDMRVSAQLKKSNYFGSLTWDGKDYRYADLSDIPKHVELKKGDSIITSYYSTIFPQGIMIGTVDEFQKAPSDNFYKIKVRLSTNFKNLNNVYIIENLFKEEQDTLELRSQTQDVK